MEEILIFSNRLTFPVDSSRLKAKMRKVKHSKRQSNFKLANRIKFPRTTRSSMKARQNRASFNYITSGPLAQWALFLAQY